MLTLQIVVDVDSSACNCHFDGMINAIEEKLGFAIGIGIAIASPRRVFAGSDTRKTKKSQNAVV